MIMVDLFFFFSMVYRVFDRDALDIQNEIKTGRGRVGKKMTDRAAIKQTEQSSFGSGRSGKNIIVPELCQLNWAEFDREES